MTLLSPEPIFKISCPEFGALTRLCLHKNERLFAGTHEGSVSLWDMETYRRLDFFEAMEDAISYMHHSNNILFLQENGGNIQSWLLDDTGYTLKKDYGTSHVAFCKAEYIQNKELLAYPKNNNTIAFIHINDEANALADFVVPPYSGHGNITFIKHINANGQDYVVAGYESGILHLWDLRSKKEVYNMKTDEYPMALDFDLNMNKGICGSANNIIKIFKYKPRKLNDYVKTIGNITLPYHGVNCLKIRNDKKVFVSGGWDGYIRIFSWKNLKELAALDNHKMGVTDIIFSSDEIPIFNSNVMIACGVDAEITFWNLFY